MTDPSEIDLLKSLEELVARAKTLRQRSRSSSEWTRWDMNARCVLEDVFGRDSSQYRSFASLRWGKAGSIIVDPDELAPGEGISEYVDRVNQRVAVQQLERAQGILLAAIDELKRKGIEHITRSRAGREAADLVRVIKLVEHHWRKTIRSMPSKEIEVQDAFENILIGSEIVYSREAESIPFGSKTYRPDFVIDSLDLAIELKLCKDSHDEKNLMAQINDDIAAYSTRYKNIIFAVYDLGIIRDVARFAGGFERSPGVVVRVVKH